MDEHGRLRKPALYNGIFSTIAFLVGAFSSVASGYIGMKIATYANARTALEARKGITRMHRLIAIRERLQWAQVAVAEAITLAQARLNRSG